MKMKNLKIIISFLFIVSTILAGTTVKSQSFGYLGKRFVVSYGLEVKPFFDVLESYESNQVSRPDESSRIIPGHQLAIEFAASRKVSMVLSAEYVKLPILNRGIQLSGNNDYTYFMKPVYSDMTVFSQSLQFRFYNHNVSAPIGFYYGLMVSRAIYTHEIDTSLTSETNLAMLEFDSQERSQAIILRLGGSVGYSRALTNRLIVGFDLAGFLNLSHNVEAYDLMDTREYQFLGNGMRLAKGMQFCSLTVRAGFAI